MWPGGFAPLGSTAAVSRLYTAASELLFMWPGGFAPLGSMAALSRLYNTAVGADCVFIVRRLRAVGQYSYSVFKPKFAADDLRSSWKNCASCMLALLQARCMWLDLFSMSSSGFNGSRRLETWPWKMQAPVTCRRSKPWWTRMKTQAVLDDNN